jgi:ATP-dependent DNA helicase RecQ
MILSCVRRVKDALGYGVGTALIMKVLRGSRDQRVLQLGLDRLSTYGLMSRLSQEAVRAYIEYLESAGYLTIDPKYTTLRLTESANQVLFRGQLVSMPVRVEPADALPEPRRPGPRQEETYEPDEGLLSDLKAVRNDLAREKNVPAYVVFSNATLRDMAARLPHTLSEFREVSGVGETKAARYGTIFLEAITAFEQER